MQLEKYIHQHIQHVLVVSHFFCRKSGVYRTRPFPMPNRRGAPLSEPVVRATQVDFSATKIAGQGLKGLLSGAWYIF